MSEQSFSGHARHHRRPGGLLERVASGLLLAMEHARQADGLAARAGWLQSLDPRAKLVGLLALLVAVVSAQRLAIIGALFCVAVLLAVGSRVAIGRVMARAWLSVLLFTGVLAIPALFLVPGDPAWQLPANGGSVTWQGLESAGFLVGRSLAASSFAILLILTTPWPQVLKALRVLRVPTVLVVLLGMTERYIFLFLKTALDMFDAKRSRALGRLSRRQTRQLAVSGTATLLSRTMHLSSEVYLAMLARGYRGEEYMLDRFRMRPRDWVWLGVSVGLASLALWLGR